MVKDMTDVFNPTAGGAIMVWKSVNDALPKEFEKVLIYTNKGFFIAWYDKYTWYTGEDCDHWGDYFDDYDEVSHWMRLTSPLEVK